MDECRFCSGRSVKAEYTFGEGYHTMRMMLGWLIGSDDDDDEEENVIDGVQLKRGNLMVFDNSSGEYKRLGVEIKYCPLCGKELHEEEET